MQDTEPGWTKLGGGEEVKNWRDSQGIEFKLADGTNSELS